MRLFTQEILHDPANGKHGDCYRACMASLLGVEPRDIPHFYDGVVVDPVEWLQGVGYHLLRMGWAGSVDELRDYMVAQNPGIPFILSGISSRGNSHAILVNGNTLWDPHPSRDGLEKPYSNGLYEMEFLVAML